MLILSASVILASSNAVRWLTVRDWLSQGQEELAAEPDAPAADAGPPAATRPSGSAAARNPAMATVLGRRHLRRLLITEINFIYGLRCPRRIAAERDDR